MRSSRHLSSMEDFVVTVAVGHVGPSVVEVEKVVRGDAVWIGMRGSVRESGSALLRYLAIMRWLGRKDAWSHLSASSST